MAADENPISDHLHAALEADDPAERDYHVRAAAQLFHAKLERQSDDSQNWGGQA